MAGIPSAGLEEGALAARGEEPAPPRNMEVWVAAEVRVWLRICHFKGIQEKRGDPGPLRSTSSPQAILLAPAPSCHGEQPGCNVCPPPNQAFEAVLLQDTLPFITTVSWAGGSCCSQSHMACQPSLVGTVTVGQMCPAA